MESRQYGCSRCFLKLNTRGLQRTQGAEMIQYVEHRNTYTLKYTGQHVWVKLAHRIIFHIPGKKWALWRLRNRLPYVGFTLAKQMKLLKRQNQNEAGETKCRVDLKEGDEIDWRLNIMTLSRRVNHILTRFFLHVWSCWEEALGACNQLDWVWAVNQRQVWSSSKPTDIGIILGTSPSPSHSLKWPEQFRRVLLPCQRQFSAQLRESLSAMAEHQTGVSVYVPPDVFDPQWQEITSWWRLHAL